MLLFVVGGVYGLKDTGNQAEKSAIEKDGLQETKPTAQGRVLFQWCFGRYLWGAAGAAGAGGFVADANPSPRRRGQGSFILSLLLSPTRRFGLEWAWDSLAYT